MALLLVCFVGTNKLCQKLSWLASLSFVIFVSQSGCRALLEALFGLRLVERLFQLSGAFCFKFKKATIPQAGDIPRQPQHRSGCRR
jgi:hypothetical protein